MEHVNSDPALLPGQTLSYRLQLSPCSASSALQALGSLTSSLGGIAAVIGPGCSAGCETTGYLTAGLNLLQISHACMHIVHAMNLYAYVFHVCIHYRFCKYRRHSGTSPALSDTTVFPTFVRTISSFASQGAMLIAIWGLLGWKRCSIITSTQNEFLLTSVSWSEQFAHANITTSPRITFSAEAFEKASLEVIRQSGIRVLIALADGKDVLTIAKLALTARMSGRQWSWCTIIITIIDITSSSTQQHLAAPSST